MSDAATAARMAGLQRDWRTSPWDEDRPGACDGEVKDPLPCIVGFSYPCDDGTSALQCEDSEDSDIGGSRLDGGSGSCGGSCSGGRSGSGGEEASRKSARRGTSLLSHLLVLTPAKQVGGGGGAETPKATSTSCDMVGAIGNANNASRAAPCGSHSSQPRSQLELNPRQPHSAGGGSRGDNPQGFQCAPSRAVPSRARTGPVEQEKGDRWHGTPRSQPIDVPKSTYLQDPDHIQELNLLQTLRWQHRAQIEAGLLINSATQAADRAAAAAAAAAAYAAAAKVMVEAGKLAPAAAMAAANTASNAAAQAKARAADVEAVVAEASTLVAQEMDAAGDVMTALQLG